MTELKSLASFKRWFTSRIPPAPGAYILRRARANTSRLLHNPNLSKAQVLDLIQRFYNPRPIIFQSILNGLPEIDAIDANVYISPELSAAIAYDDALHSPRNRNILVSDIFGPTIVKALNLRDAALHWDDIDHLIQLINSEADPTVINTVQVPSEMANTLWEMLYGNDEPSLEAIQQFITTTRMLPKNVTVRDVPFYPEFRGYFSEPVRRAIGQAELELAKRADASFDNLARAIINNSPTYAYFLQQGAPLSSSSTEARHPSIFGRVSSSGQVFEDVYNEAVRRGEAERLINLENENGETPIFFAGSPAALLDLIKHGADPGHINKYGVPAFVHIATRSDGYETTDAFIDWIETTYMPDLLSFLDWARTSQPSRDASKWKRMLGNAASAIYHSPSKTPLSQAPRLGNGLTLAESIAQSTGAQFHTDNVRSAVRAMALLILLGAEADPEKIETLCGTNVVACTTKGLETPFLLREAVERGLIEARERALPLGQRNVSQLVTRRAREAELCEKLDDAFGLPELIALAKAMDIQVSGNGLHVSKRRLCREISEKLSQAGKRPQPVAKPVAQSERYERYMSAVKSGNLDLVRHLIDQEGQDVDEADPEVGTTVLKTAITEEVNPEVIQLLLRRGANLLHRAKNGETPALSYGLVRNAFNDTDRAKLDEAILAKGKENDQLQRVTELVDEAKREGFTYTDKDTIADRTLLDFVYNQSLFGKKWLNFPYREVEQAVREIYR